MKAPPSASGLLGPLRLCDPTAPDPDPRDMVLTEAGVYAPRHLAGQVSRELRGWAAGEPYQCPDRSLGPLLLALFLAEAVRMLRRGRGRRRAGTWAAPMR